MTRPLIDTDVLRDLVREVVREVLAEQRPAPDDLLTVAEAASIAKVRPAAIRAWIAEGKLVAGRIGTRRFRIKRSDLDAALQPTRAEPAPVSPQERARQDVARLRNRT